MSMQTVLLGEVAEFLNGGTPSKSCSDFFNGDIPWITGADITSSIVKTARSYITDQAVRKSATNVVPAGTVLLVTRTSVGKVAITGVPLAFSQDITAIVHDPGRVDSKYLAHFLTTQQVHFERVARGATIKGITRSVVESVRLPLPPLDEQRRIVAILDQAEELRAKRRAAIALLDQLPQAIFLEMFGDPASNPKGWGVSPLGSAFDPERGARCGPFGSALHRSDYIPNGIPVWGIDNVGTLQFNETGSLFVDERTFMKLTAYDVRSGDILITRAGTVGKMCVARPAASQSMIGTNLIRLSLNQEAADPDFVAILLTHFGRSLGSLRANAKEEAYSFMKTGILKTLPVPLPPIDLQRRFASCVEALRHAREAHESSLAELDVLFASIQTATFSGMKSS